MKLLRKFTSIILTLSFLCAMSITSFSAKETAKYVDLPTDETPVSAEFTQAGETHYYKITLNGSCGMSISVQKLTNPETCMTAYVYDEKMTCISQELLYDANSFYNSNELDYALVDGIYYLALTAKADCVYTLTCKANEKDASYIANNNYFTTAYKLNENESVIGEITINDRVDVYKMVLSERKKVEFYTANTVADIPSWGIYYELYKGVPKREYGNSYTHINKEKCYYHINEEGSNSEYYDDDEFYEDNFWWWGYDSLVLDAGTYYFVFQSKYLNETGKYRIMYKTDEPTPVLKTYADGVKFNVKSVSIKAGEQLIFDGIDCSVKKWKSSNKKIIKVDKVTGSGRVRGVQKGTAKLIAVLKNGEELTCKITVTTDPKIIDKNNKKITSITIKKGRTKTVRLSGVDAFSSEIKYINGKNATIRQGDCIYRNGSYLYKLAIKGKKVGTSYVKVKVNDDKTLKLKVKVK